MTTLSSSMPKVESHGALDQPNQRQTVVIKVGTSSLIRPDMGTLNLSSLAGLVELVRDLKTLGFNVILVTSGAAGVGCQRLGLSKKPAEVSKRQALAAVGQIHLMRHYDDLFAALGLKCAQVLLTLDNLAVRSQYVNARSTFFELLRFDCVPIVNENDTLAVEELRFGDNDTLSAQVAALVGASWLFLLTDVDALYSGNPHVDPQAKRIPEVEDVSELQVSVSGAEAAEVGEAAAGSPGAPSPAAAPASKPSADPRAGSAWGTGGMATKLTAARIATAAGVRMVICHFRSPQDVVRALAGEQVGTVFHRLPAPLKGRKRWILSVPVRGAVVVDAGAARAVRKRSSLFSAGVVKVHGQFQHQDCVAVVDSAGVELARGLVNYSARDLARIQGQPSSSFERALGFQGPEEVVHRANMCVLVKDRQARAQGASLGSLEETEAAERRREEGQRRREERRAARARNADGGGEAPAARAADLAPSPALSADGSCRSASSSRSDLSSLGSAREREPSLAQRLALLRGRGGPEDPREHGMLEGWTEELRRAVQAEAEGATRSGAADADADEDVDERGWLPRA